MVYKTRLPRYSLTSHEVSVQLVRLEGAPVYRNDGRGALRLLQKLAQGTIGDQVADILHEFLMLRGVTDDRALQDDRHQVNIQRATVG
jgi:hypothetical protein